MFLINISGLTAYNLGINVNQKSKGNRSRPHLMIGLGSSTFLGELGGKPTLGTDDPSDIDLSTTRYAISAGLWVPMGRTFAFRGLLSYARLSGDDKYTINRERRGRNLNFTTPLSEGSLALEISPGSSKRFYVYAGSEWLFSILIQS